MDRRGPRVDHTWWRTLFVDPVLLAMVLWSAAAGVLLFTGQGHPDQQVQVLWVAQVPLDLALVIGSWRLQRLAHGAVRRFWLVFAATATAFTFGDAFQAVLTFVRPGPDAATGGVVQSLCFGVGQLAVIITMLIHPHSGRGGVTRTAMWLDSATVLVGGGALAWCFAVAPAGNATVWTTDAGTAVVAVVAAFAAVKMVLSGNAPMNKSAAVPMVTAAVVVCISMAMARTSAASAPAYLVQLIPSLLIAVGPRIQELSTRGLAEPFAPHARKSYSLVPYGAVAVALGTLIACLPSGVDNRLFVAVAGVTAVTGLVVARQLVAFRDNNHLIARLDTTLAELREHEVRLSDQARYDGLTKLANRTYFNELVDRALSGPAPAGGLHLLLVDLDNFKSVNDTMGHAAGDTLLAEIAARLRLAVRADDAVGRLGGDEFGVVLEGVSAVEAENIAERILAAVIQPIRLKHADLAMGVSIGVAAAEPGDTLETLMSDADIAMYAAKGRGRGTWVRYTSDLGAQTRRTAELASRMREGLDAGEFSVVYQPIVRLAGGELTGVEALVRWHAGPVQIFPDEFIPVAEESGLIVRLGSWVLATACAQAAAWHRAHPRAAGLVVNVNTAGRQLRTPGFAAEVGAILTRTGLPAECLTIEITETAVFDDEIALRTLHQLRELGVQLALDDFGTAASSLGLLLTCPVTSLKLDRSFVEGILRVDRQAAVARAVVHMANALHLGAVAEGIETPEQAALLRDMGYEYGQGYLFARPLPPAEVEALLRPGVEPGVVVG